MAETADGDDQESDGAIGAGAYEGESEQRVASRWAGVSLYYVSAPNLKQPAVTFRPLLCLASALEGGRRGLPGSLALYYYARLTGCSCS